MASLKAIELKFLLELVKCDGYRSNIVKIKPNSQTSASDRNRTCEDLVSRGYVDCTKEISRFVISGAGKALLNKNLDNLPIQLDPKEIKALEACTEKITPGQLGKKVPTDERQTLLRNLSDRGLIKVSETKITDVWLSAQGNQFLLHEYAAKGTWGLTATKVGYYIQFLRENTGQQQPQKLFTHQPSQQRPLSQASSGAMPIGSQRSSKPNAQTVLQQIKQLNQLVGGNKNYLPIYHLREKLQPPLSRSELDSLLYELQRADQIDLDSLHDQGEYTNEQVTAGIRQDNGGYLFFISVL